jgi:uncharacterized GH25 family protein
VSALKRVGIGLGLLLLIVAALAARYALQRREHLQLREADTARGPVVAPKRAQAVQLATGAAPSLSCVRGVVLDHGSGVAGMQVSLSDSPPQVSGDCPCARPATLCACRDGLALISTQPRAGLTEAVKSAVTAADGHFELCGLEGSGQRLIWGEHLDGRMATPPLTQSPLVAPGAFVELELVPMLTVKGIVLSAQTPVPGASVQAFTSPPLFARTVTADAKGRFETKLPLNTVSFVVTAPGKSPQLLNQSCEPGQVLVLTLHDEAQLTIRALHEGKPVAGASVSIPPEAALLTDAQGLAPVSGLVAGVRTTVRVTKGELLGAATFAALTQKQLDVELKKGVHVRGVVLDENGQPRAGKVRGLPTKFVPSDAQGRFTSELLEPFAEVYPVAVVEGCADSDRKVVELTGADVEVTLKVACTETVTGSVVDAEGKPIEGATVFLDSLEGREDTTTTANGQFHFHQPPGTYQLRVSHERYRGTEQPLQVPAKDVTVVLDAGGSIAGRVVDAKGAGVPGAEVTVVPAVLDELLTEIEGGHMRATTDVDGRFETSGLFAGRLVVAASADSQGTTVSDVVVLQPGEHREGLVLTLDEKLDLQGTVTDEQHRPIPGARVTWDPSDEKSAMLGVVMDAVRGRVDQVLKFLPSPGMTDADGHFVVRGLPVSSVKLEVRVNGFEEQSRVVARGGVADFVLKREGGVIRGRVIDESGRPLSRFEVDGAAFTPEDGRFEVQSRSKEDTVSVTAKGFTRQQLTVTMSAPEKDVGDVVMKKGLALTVQVSSSDGKPLEGAHVAAVQKVDGDRCTTRTDGTCVIEPLLDLETTVKAEKDGYVPLPATVAAGQLTVPLKLTLEKAGGKLKGVAFALPGRAAAARNVFMSGDVTAKGVLTDGTGHFLLEGIPEGAYCASIDIAGGRSFEWAVPAVASATPTDVQVGPVALGAVLEGSRTLPGRMMLVQGAVGPIEINDVLNRSASSQCTASHATALTMIVTGAFRIEGLPPGRWSVFFVSITQSDDTGTIAPISIELLPNETRQLP